MDRSTTPRVSQSAQTRRQKTRSRSGSDDLNLIIEQGQQARSCAAASQDMSASSSSSGLASPSTPVPDRINSPGVLSWVRNALLLGSPGRNATTQPAAFTGDDNIVHLRENFVMPGSIPLSNRSSPLTKSHKLPSDSLSIDDPIRSLHSQDAAPTQEKSTWNSLNRSLRRFSAISTATTADDDTVSSSSSDEDVYAPFTFKEDDTDVAGGSDVFERPEAINILPSTAKESPLPVQDITHSFSSHLSIYQAQDSNQFVQDTTTAKHPMPDLVLTPPDTSYQGSTPLSPTAGWTDTFNNSRPDIDRRHSHNKTPTPGNALGKIETAGIESTDSNNSFFSSGNAEGSEDGDGEDLEDFLGRPRSPEELAKTRPSRETVVLGSRGASSRGAIRGKPLKVTTSGQEVPEIEQEYWDATSPKSPSSNPNKSPTLARIAMDRRAAAGGVANSQPTNDGSSIIQTASPQPRRAMNFFTRRREVSFGGKGASEAERSEGKKDTTAANAAFWRLGKKQSNLSSIDIADDEAEYETDKKGNVKATRKHLDGTDTLVVQRPGLRASHESDRSFEPDTPSKNSLRANDSVGKSSNSKKKGGLALLKPSMQPRSVKVRRLKKTTKDRDFSRVYLAQELFLGINASGLEDTPASADVDVKPTLAHLDSSSSVASSFASSATTGSKGSNTSPKRKATWAMKFSLDGKHLAIAGQDAIIRVYAVLDTEAARRKIQSDAAAASETLLGLPGYNDNGSTCSVNSLGKNSLGRKSFSSREGSAKVSSLPNLAVFRQAPVREFKGHTNDILDLNWSKGGFLLSASMDKTARVWHLSHANSLVSFVHGDFVTSAVFHPRDDRFFLSGSLDGKLRLWNISAKKVQSSQEVPGLITACAFTETGNTACVGTFAGHALFYQTEGLIYTSSIAVRSPSGKHSKGGRKITSIEPLLSLPASTYTPAGAKSQGERILITSNDSRIRAYDLKNKSMIARFKAKTYTNRTSQIRANVSDDNVFIVAGSEATYNERGQVYIWNASNHLLDTTKKTSTKSLPSTLSTDFNVEYFSAHSGTVTCAIMAPLSTNDHLKTSSDYLLQESDRRLTKNAKISPSGSLTNALSQAVAYPIKLATGSNEADTRRLNRIIVSVDENAVVRVWRSDSLNTVEG